MTRDEAWQAFQSQQGSAPQNVDRDAAYQQFLSEQQQTNQQPSSFLGNIASGAKALYSGQMTPQMQNAPQSAQNLFNFVSGAVHPLTPQKTLSGIAGQVTPYLIAPEASGIAKLAGMGADALGLGRTASALGTASNAMNPALANGWIGALGRGALGGAATGGLYSLPSGNPGFGAGVGGAVGAVGVPVGGAVNRGISAGQQYLKDSQVVQNLLDKFTGGTPPVQVQGDALQKINQVRQSAQQISNTNYQNVFGQAKQLGIDASNPPNLLSTAQGLVDNVSRLGPEYNGLKNDVLMASQPFNLQNRLYYVLKSTMNDPRSALVTAGQLANTPPKVQQQIIAQLSPEEQKMISPVISNPFGLEDINNLKQSFQQDAQKALTQGDMKAHGVYSQLANSARQDTFDLTQGTPIQEDLTNAHNFYQQHVLPLQQFKQMAQQNDLNGFRSTLVNPKNSDVYGALTPSAISQSNGLDSGLLDQARNASKAALITNLSQDASRAVDPKGTLSNFQSFAANNPALISPQKDGDSPLFSQDDEQQIRKLISQVGVDKGSLSSSDAAYAAMVASGHHPLAYGAKKAVDVMHALLPFTDKSKYLNNPSVTNALMNGGIPAGLKSLQGLVKTTPYLQGAIPALSTIPGLLAPNQ